MAGTAAQARINGRKGGRPKGAKSKSTIDKEAAREALRQIVLRDMDELVRAQIHSATGISHFMLRDKTTGQWRRLTNWREIEAALNDTTASAGSTYWIYTKDPSTQAFTDLMNRALDKPKEQEQEIKLSGDDALITALMNGRKYAQERRGDS